VDPLGGLTQLDILTAIRNATVSSTLLNSLVDRVTTCLENLEMLGNFVVNNNNNNVTYRAQIRTGSKCAMKKFIRHKGSTGTHGELKIYTEVEYSS